MVIYFTGTGNSRFAAERIAEISGDRTYDSGESLRVNEQMSFGDEDVLVFVCPVYVSAMPKPFYDLIMRSHFKKGAKAYFFMTYAGGIGASDRYGRKICEVKGLTYMGTSGAMMPQNYLIYFKMGSQEQNRKIVEDALAPITNTTEHIKRGEVLPDAPCKISHYMLAKITYQLYDKLFITAKKFRATDKCVGCSLCAKVCPMGNISMKDGLPVWVGKCTHCMGCINLCPKEAVEFGKNSLGKSRYQGPAL